MAQQAEIAKINSVALNEIVEVKECSSGLFQHDLTELNVYLQAGWVMLATFTSGRIDEGQHQNYSLGWIRSKGEPVHPEYEDRWAKLRKGDSKLAE